MTAVKPGLFSRAPRKQPDRTPALDALKLALQEISPALKLRVSARAKRMALRLDSKSGNVFLVLPTRASLRKGFEFAQEHREWVLKHATASPDSIVLTTGSVLPILGQDRVIRINYDPAFKRTQIQLISNELIVNTNKDDPTQRIVRHLKNMAREEITRLSHEKAKQINRMPRAIRIGDTKSRWGSCSQEGNLAFSWRLILAPLESFDYVIAHEVAHLAHMDHGARFWALCEELSTDFSTGHGWMKKHGHTLMRYC